MPDHDERRADRATRALATGTPAGADLLDPGQSLRPNVDISIAMNDVISASSFQVDPEHDGRAAFQAGPPVTYFRPARRRCSPLGAGIYAGVWLVAQSTSMMGSDPSGARRPSRCRIEIDAAAISGCAR